MASFFIFNAVSFIGGYALGRLSGFITRPQETIVTMQTPPTPVEVQPPEYPGVSPTAPPLYPKMMPRK
jgi:hypothetical protein